MLISDVRGRRGMCWIAYDLRSNREAKCFALDCCRGVERVAELCAEVED